MSTVIQSVAPVVSPTFTGTLTANRIVATSTTDEHQFYGSYTAGVDYTKAGVVLFSHSDGTLGASAFRAFGPGTSKEYTAMGSGSVGTLYEGTFIEASDEQDQGSGRPMVFVQRSTLGATKTYASAIRFKIAPTSGGPMTFYSSTGAAQIIGITDGAVEIGTGAQGTGQLRVAADSGYTTGGVAFRDGNGAITGQVFGSATGAFYIKGGTAHGTGIVNAAGDTVVAYIGDAGTAQFTGMKLGYVAKTTTYAIGANDYVIDVTANSFTVTLPTAVGRTGQVYIVRNSGAGTTTIATTSAQTVNGTTPATIAAGAVLRYQSTGANWITF